MIRLVDNDTILAWLFDFRNDDGALVAMILVEGCDLFERVVASNVRVEDEEGRVILAEGFLSKLQGTSCA